MFVISNGLIQTPPEAASVNYTFRYPGGSPVISANGATGGILWALETSQWNTGGPSTLYAFDATNLKPPSFTTVINSAADQPGTGSEVHRPHRRERIGLCGDADPARGVRIVPRWKRSATPTATATASARDPDRERHRHCFGDANLTATPSATDSDRERYRDALRVRTATATPQPQFPRRRRLRDRRLPRGADVQHHGHADRLSEPGFRDALRQTAVDFVLRSGRRSSEQAGQVIVTNTAATNAVTMSALTVTSGFVVTASNCPAVLNPAPRARLASHSNRSRRASWLGSCS